MSKRMMISCYSGLAPVGFPSEWLKNFDMQHGFAHQNDKAQIYFKGVKKAFEVWIEYDGPQVIQHSKELTQKEIDKISWGEFCEPWEPYKIMKIFGRNQNIIELN